MLKRRKESDTYLAADRRHCRSTQIAMKVDKCVAFSRHCSLHQERFHSGEVHRGRKGTRKRTRNSERGKQVVNRLSKYR